MTVRESDVDRVASRVENEPVDFDGFHLAREADGYHVETPDYTVAGLDRTDLSDALEPVAPYLSNWRYWQETVGGKGTARRAFLRWCERAPVRGANGASAEESLDVPARYDALETGIDRAWGQLRVTARLIDEADPQGVRVYDLWHADDADADLADLDVYEDLDAIRELVRTDADGHYRPLKTAPTLVSGWAFVGLTGAELVDAVDRFYPATVANWHRECRGELDLDHWHETAERQTGIYDVVDELPREAVDWMAEACCVDEECLRRREWEYAADDALDVDGGAEPFPCREPCSLVIAAARRWAIDESESERTWTVELTRTEVNQLAELVCAVAEGRTDEIREADLTDGANRYRARYLRSKRLDEEGRLPFDPAE